MDLFDRRDAPKRADTWFVYELVDSRQPEEVRYIGITNDPRRRLSHHCSQCLESHTRKSRWIAKVLADGGDILMRVMRSGLGHDEAKANEIRRISECKDSPLLTNLTGGGDGTSGRIYSAETRERIAASRRGRSLSADTRELLRVQNTGRVSPNKGKTLSKEWRANISASGIARMLDPAVREQISAQGVARYANENERSKTATATRMAGPPCDNKSGFKGVSYNTRTGKWVAQIKLCKQTYLGRYHTPEAAARAYDAAAYAAWGNDCYLNFPAEIAA